MTLLPYATPEPSDAAPNLLENIVDAQTQIRQTARLYAALVAPESPEVLDVLRAALKHPNRDDVLSTIYIAGG